MHTPYKITSKRGQALYKGQRARSQTCPLFRGSTVLLILSSTHSCGEHGDHILEFCWQLCNLSNSYGIDDVRIANRFTREDATPH